MNNLRHKVACSAVDLIYIVQRLYSDKDVPVSAAAATATVLVHYGQERKRSVQNKVHQAFWAGAEVLRAMAQYHREAKHTLKASANLHVIPIMLRNNEGRVYGLHYGVRYIAWQAEGKSAWPRATCLERDWAEELLKRNNQAASMLDSVNSFINSENTNAVIIGAV
ncbi:hypothetical protein CCR75_001760 [Bremia lactucae]|uniref:Uncharacterized protein n=1 Tax=Bremia lactucae TaxID=4779 RepID=A0A976FJE5_BRELC|nr:hypothetical protein CCR75_002656 [Bremia lactucae]TDH71642.1 hypothetical protein CCR75_001760 [Bremia lactucae]